MLENQAVQERKRADEAIRREEIAKKNEAIATKRADEASLREEAANRKAELLEVELREMQAMLKVQGNA